MYRTGSAFEEQVKLTLAYDFNTLFCLKGLKAYSNLRYRNGNDINNITGAANGFGPSNIRGGKELRLMSQYLGYTALDGKWIINAGWMNPYDQFLQQPLAKAIPEQLYRYRAKAVSSCPFNMGFWDFYWQADQMLYRAHDPETQAIVSADGKTKVDTKSPAEVSQHPLSKKGLYMFNVFTFSPQQYSLIDFYYQTGLIYQGLILGRPDDRMGLALGTAWFSADSASAYRDLYDPVDSQRLRRQNQLCR